MGFINYAQDDAYLFTVRRDNRLIISAMAKRLAGNQFTTNRAHYLGSLRNPLAAVTEPIVTVRELSTNEGERTQSDRTIILPMLHGVV
jgi:hypothetical protein